jgi:GNAT superfamily N-acetyltransferase
MCFSFSTKEPFMSRLTLTQSNGRPSFKIRMATLRDIDTLVRHRRAMWKDLGVRIKPPFGWGDGIYGRWIWTRLKSHRLVGWLVEDEGGVVAGSGCVWLQPIHPRPHHQNTKLQPYLLSMYTERNFRKLGVASMIVNAAIVWCKKKGYGRILLHSSPMGRDLYSKFGFKRGWEMHLDLE